MFNKECLKKAISEYKKQFVQNRWVKEKYKWEAVKQFQDSWDINADDFATMLKKSFSKTGNLLTSRNNFPGNMIIEFADIVPEKVRSMFSELFDETKDVYQRIDNFKQQSNILLETYRNDAAQHYQNENAISTYLWLRYPDKYYIYKFSEVKAVSNELECDYSFKRSAYEDNIRNFFALYNEICEELKKDEELRATLASHITGDCYSDSALKTLTIDVGFFISRYLHQEKNDSSKDKWELKDYTPNLSIDDWEELLNNNEIFSESSLEIMKRILDYGGSATCKQLSKKYGESTNFYNTGSSSLAKRIAQKTGCQVLLREDGSSKWWPILYIGKDAKKDEEGSFVWKLRDELFEALKRIDLTDIKLYAEDTRYWFLNAKPKIWSMASMPVGTIEAYTLYNDRGNKRRIFQNFIDAKVGDMVIGYESTPVKQIVALMRVSDKQGEERIYFEKLEGLSSPIDYVTLKTCIELEKMEYFINSQGSLFKLTKDEYEFILDMIREENPILSIDDKKIYTKQDFLNDVYMNENEYNRLVGVLKKKKNIILQGAPGVGKTFTAKRLAYSLMGEVDDNRIEFVQFHQNYSYEDFMMGYRPVEAGFALKYGIFYRFCQRAANHPDQDYFFIIDEINRGNMSKIFGELLMSIESDYRGKQVTLAYNGMSFTVPERVHIIGMMNTADRSLAMIDYALRRRFSFFNMEPGFDSEGFLKYQQQLANDRFNKLIGQIKALNQEIMEDRSLGKGFCIGHSYFCNASDCSEEWMQDIVDFDILPMLSEYWFDELEKLQRWEEKLHGVFK